MTDNHKKIGSTRAASAGAWGVEYPEYPDVVTVACVNFEGVASDGTSTKPFRLDKMIRQVRDAARQGAQLVVFPESALGALGATCAGCSVDSGPSPEHQAWAEPVPGPSTDVFTGLAAELGVYIIFGIDEAPPEHPGRIHNSAVLVGPEGLVGTYRKLHLGHPLETRHYTPGSELPVFQTSLGPIGILICYDFWSNPELSRVLALKGARILVNPTRSAANPGKAEYVRNTTVVRAQENLLYAMSANWTGPSVGEGAAAGNSTIAGPAYPAFNKIFAAAGEEEQVIVATLNFRQLGRWYDLFPWRQWRLDPARQLPITRIVARELDALANAHSGADPAVENAI
ncbi:MAG: carbon-nitrogen hydrolase family protein [Halioglobus sp.]|nr:carbon-nitrogen hydrolase family protein [Halioglobus sp.]